MEKRFNGNITNINESTLLFLMLKIIIFISFMTTIINNNYKYKFCRS